MTREPSSAVPKRSRVMEAMNTNRPPSERTKEQSNKTTLMRMVSQVVRVPPCVSNVRPWITLGTPGYRVVSARCPKVTEVTVADRRGWPAYAFLQRRHLSKLKRSERRSDSIGHSSREAAEYQLPGRRAPGTAAVE